MSGVGRLIEIESRLEVVRGLGEEKTGNLLMGMGFILGVMKYSGTRWW